MATVTQDESQASVGLGKNNGAGAVLFLVDPTYTYGAGRCEYGYHGSLVRAATHTHTAEVM